MKPLDHDALAKAMVGGAKRYVDAALAPLLKRLDEAEQRAAAAESKLADMVARAVGDLPPAEPGKSVTIEDCRPLIEEAASRIVSEAVRGIAPPKDGVGMAGAMIDRKGCLVLTLSDGTTKELGRVVGKSVTADEVGALVDSAVGAVPPPAAGKDADMDAVFARVDDRLAEAEKAIPGMVAEAVGALPAPQPGKDSDPNEVAEIVRGMIADDLAEVIKAVNDIPPARELPDIPSLIDAAVIEAVAALPAPQPGKDADPEATAALVRAEVEKAVGGLPMPKDGVSVTVEDVRPLIDDAIAKAVAEIPAPKDGTSVTPDQVRPMLAELVEDAVKAIPVSEAPLGYAKGLIDRDGHLVFTRTDGTTEDVGPVVGTDADMDAIKAKIEEMVAAIPKPEDGKDGVGFDDMDIALSDDERTLTISAGGLGNRKEWAFRLSHVLDRGVYELGKSYQKGDGVTFAGSFFVAQKDTGDKPETGSAWRLAVKRGRDGKEPVNLKGGA